MPGVIVGFVAMVFVDRDREVLGRLSQCLGAILVASQSPDGEKSLVLCLLESPADEPWVLVGRRPFWWCGAADRVSFQDSRKRRAQ